MGLGPRYTRAESHEVLPEDQQEQLAEVLHDEELDSNTRTAKVREVLDLEK